MEKNLGMLSTCAFDGAEVRVLGTPEEPWFVAKDVCGVLGYKNSRDAIAKHVDDDDKNTVAFRDGKRGNPKVVIINESGLYSLIFSSELPEAKKFKHWVTYEVLPAIRKKGYYAVPSIQEHIDALINQTEVYHYEVAEKIMGVKINSMADWNRAKKLEHEAHTVELEKERGYKHTLGSYFGKYYRAADSVCKYNLSKDDVKRHTSVIGGQTYMDDYLIGEIEKVMEKQGFDKCKWRKEA